MECWLILQLVMDYGDVIPRKDYDDVITQLEGVKESFEELKQDFTTLNMEQDMLQESYKLSLSEKQSVSQDLERLKGSATPRPLWDRLVPLDTTICTYRTETIITSNDVITNPGYYLPSNGPRTECWHSLPYAYPLTPQRICLFGVVNFRMVHSQLLWCYCLILNWRSSFTSFSGPINSPLLVDVIVIWWYVVYSPWL